VLADELVQTLDVLDRDGLVEHIHRFGLHACELGDPAVILVVLVGRAKAALFHLLAHAFGGGEVGAVLSDRLLALGEGIDLLGTTVTAKVQNLRYGEGIAAIVLEGREQG